MKLKPETHLEIYPNGEIAILSGDAVSHEITQDQVIEIMRSNMNAEWITKDDIRAFVKRLQEEFGV